jgi:predicted TIM-barrel fold metal-dependent hydrolase
MVGTNLPVDRLFATGFAIRGAIAAAVTPLTESEREAVLVDTAKSVYRIENTAPLVRT